MAAPDLPGPPSGKISVTFGGKTIIFGESWTLQEILGPHLVVHPTMFRPYHKPPIIRDQDLTSDTK